MLTDQTERTLNPELRAAVQDALAPLRLVDLFDRAVAFVVDGGDPEVLGALEGLAGVPLVARASAPRDKHAEVAERSPGWSPKLADRARLLVYRDAPVDLVARLGQVRHASALQGRYERDQLTAAGASWLVRLAADVARCAYSVPAEEGGRAVLRHWRPDLLVDAARAGGAAGATAVHAALTAMLFEGSIVTWFFLDDDEGDAFLARHAAALADVVGGLGDAGRRFVALRAARDAVAHVPVLVRLAADHEKPIQRDALATLSLLDGRTQVAVLQESLPPVSEDAVPAILARLADLRAEGGLEVIEAWLAREESSPSAAHVARLRTTSDRLRRLGSVTVEVPPVDPPTDPDVCEELRTRPAQARLEGHRFWPEIQDRVQHLPDVRALRDALRAAGLSDADRRVSDLLVRPRHWIADRKLGTLLTADDAERWWPLFAERLDLLDEHLDGLERDALDWDDEEHVDTTEMALTILERFPEVPDVLVPRLTDLALGTSRHRQHARQVLVGVPAGRTAALDALGSDDVLARASAAEWLAAAGEPGVEPPAAGWEFGDGVLPPEVLALGPTALRRLNEFRDEALSRGVPALDVDRWLGRARPALRTRWDDSGQVVGRLGGPLLLPPDTPASADVWELTTGEERRSDHQLIATIDLAAIAPGDTDLQFPPDGQFLLFANVDLETPTPGGAVYVAAGAPVEERRTELTHEVYEYGTPERLDDHLRAIGTLRMDKVVSLPETKPDKELVAQHPHWWTMTQLWVEVISGDGDGWQIGGHAADFDDQGDPALHSAREHGEAATDWVLLAQWAGFPMARVYWTIRRADLAAGRFDRVEVHTHSNP